MNYEYFGQILKSSKIFYLNFSENFINSLAQNMKEMHLAPNEILFKSNVIENKLFFIINGEI